MTHRFQMFLLLAFVLTACGGGGGVDTNIQPVISTAIASAPEIASTAVAKATGPEYPEPPQYPTDGSVPPAGIYQAPVTGGPAEWLDFPAYPDNTSGNPFSGQNPGNCGLESNNWEICSYMYGWTVSVFSPNSVAGMYIHPADFTRYLIVESAVSGGDSIKTYESQSVAISDGVTVIVVRMTIEASANTFSYELGYMP